MKMLTQLGRETTMIRTKAGNLVPLIIAAKIEFGEAIDKAPEISASHGLVQNVLKAMDRLVDDADYLLH